MKDLKMATDFEIYWMRELIQTLNFTKYASKITRKIERELDKEYKRRGIIPCLAWDLCPEKFKKVPEFQEWWLSDEPTKNPDQTVMFE